MKSTYLDPYFSPVFLTDYIRENLNGLKRFQIYNLFRFLSAADEKSGTTAHFLCQLTNAPLSEHSWQVITDYLEKDFYFSPAIHSDSYDAFLLYYAIWLIEDRSGKRDRFLYQIFSQYCPIVQHIQPSDASADLPIAKGDALAFFGFLAYISCLAPAQLSKFLPKFADIYWEELHFTCEDFILYNFMDEYFEISNCRSNPKFQKLIAALSDATLKAQNVTLEECTAADGIQQLCHPSSQLAGLYRYGALDFSDFEDSKKACKKMQHLLDYAVTCELRRNLFDFHLDEDRIITLDNWTEKLKWYHVQYDSAYAQAISSFYTAALSQKLLKMQFLDHLRAL